MTRLFLLLIFLSVIFVPYYFIFLRPPPPLPDMDLDAWWGPEHLKGKKDVEIRPFKIKFNTEIVQDLRERIKNQRSWTPPLEDAGFEYGFNTNHIDEWLDYWTNSYPFEERIKFFNKYSHYKTNIQGLKIHFVHVTPEVPAGVEVVPVLMMHGWPGSVREFYEAIPYLTAYSKDRDFAVELVIPSLPGYGFSEAAQRPGLGAAEVAVIMRNLMHRLGYKKYYVQGGDWGGFIGTNMATLFPEDVLGLHINGPIAITPAATLISIFASIYPPLIMDSKLVDRMYPLTKHWSWLMQETGYLHLQATKPDTLGVALADSPAGLLAYIFEKFATWTHGNRALTKDLRYTREQLIDNLMFYWMTNTITTSMRLYSESFNKRQMELRLNDIPTSVPTWGLQARYELSYQPPIILRLKYKNLVGLTVLDDGGHFIAFEMPEVFAEDVLKAINEFRKLKKVKTEL